MSPLQLLFLILTFSSTTTTSTSNPFTPKSSFIRYYALKIPKNPSIPTFLLSKLSPLSPPSSTSLPSPLSLSFCSSARILCSSVSLSLSSPTSLNNSFTSYSTTNFSNYGDSTPNGHDSFSSYSPDLNLPSNSFRRYSHSSSNRPDSFSSYASDGNTVSTDFSSYASSSTSASGSFSSYAHDANIPNIRFSTYDTDAVDRPRDFTSYSDDTNSGSQRFTNYAKSANNVHGEFLSYAKDANVMESSFTSYSQDGNGGGDGFTSYGEEGNVPNNGFRQYGENGNGVRESFKGYRVKANVGQDSFQSYAKHSNAENAEFEGYGKSFNNGVDMFKGYGEDSTDLEVGFKGYDGKNTTFKDYAKTGVTFSGYRSGLGPTAPPVLEGNMANRWVEPGKFFRESSIKSGTMMVMADVRDKMPKRSFLPRSIAQKLPFKVRELSSVFGVREDSALWKAMEETIGDCERAPSKGETKRCVASAEDMVDFAVSMLGNDVAVRSIDSGGGSGKEIVIGNVKGIDGGRVTKSVSCHQSLFPYLMYYCHSVPKVRVYEADILDAYTKERINRGVAICHLDTTDWSPTHGAFLALGAGPGKVEVCHWIFEGDMVWTVGY